MEELTKDDYLNRKEFVSRFINIIENYDKDNFSIAIDGLWGIGKSWILNNIENQLKEKYIIIKFNAWENDFYEEPLIALLTTIIDQLNLLKTSNYKIAKAILDECINKIKAAISFLSKQKFGFDVLEKVKNVKMWFKKKTKIENTIDDHANLKLTIEQVKEALAKITNEHKLFFLVDELDRCLPNQAIKTLERTHHIFTGLKNCILVYAFDKAQLTGMIGNIYNTTKFNSEQYFKKLFNITLKLGVGLVNDNFVSAMQEYLSKFSTNEKIKKDFTIQEIFNTLLQNVPIREKIDIVELATIAHKITAKNISIESDYSMALYELLIACCHLKYEHDYTNMKANYILPDRSNGGGNLALLITKLFKDKVSFVPSGYSNQSVSTIDENNLYYRSIVFWYLTNICTTKAEIIFIQGNSDAKTLEFKNKFAFLEEYRKFIELF